MAGSCHGGNHLAVYEFVKQSGFWPYDTCLQYAACSAESTEGICSAGDYTCKPINTCRTCSTFSAMGGFCGPIDVFPNATIAEYGQVAGETDMMAVRLRPPHTARAHAHLPCTHAKTPTHRKSTSADRLRAAWMPLLSTSTPAVS